MLGTTLNPKEFLARVAAELGRIDSREVQKLADLMWERYQAGRFVFVIGNGGSGSNASHFCEDIGKGFLRLHLKYGYRDLIDLPRALATAPKSALSFEYAPMNVSYFISRETLIATGRKGMSYVRKLLFIWMWRTAVSSMEMFKLPTNRVVELGTQVEM